MFARLKTEFGRYFFMTAPPNSYAKAIYETFGIYSKSRDALSEIIPGRVYLTNMPLSSPFKKASHFQLPEQSEAALVVSSIDISELATSPLLLEPDAPQLKYHVLAMQDATAVVGSIDQVFETLRLMSTFADSKKPILIHCYSGVGRSAMMTAIHIAHRYLLGDEVVKTLIDTKIKLDVNNSTYIKELYDAVSKFVLSKRDCCQFEATLRNDFAAHVLTELHRGIQSGHSYPEARDESYQFLATFVQTLECKRLQNHFYHTMQSPSYSYVPSVVPVIAAKLGATSITTQESADPKKMVQKFFDDFLSNTDGWFQQLLDVVRNEKSDSLLGNRASNPLEQFCNDTSNAGTEEKQSTQSQERRELLHGVLDTMIQLAIRFPKAAYSEQILASLKLQTDLKITPGLK